MRYLRIVLTLVFGLAMVGPEAHACPVHDQTPAHHQHASSQHQRGHCTCPQACCPAAVRAALPRTPAPWTAAPKLLLLLDPDQLNAIVLPARPRLLPFGLAPPLL